MKVRLDEIIEKTFAGEWGSDDVDNNGIPVLRTTNFTNDGTVNYSDVVTRKITKENINHKFLKKGDILIEKSGGSNKQPVGRVVYFVGEENKFLFNNFTGLIRVKNYDKWSSEYIFYSLFVNYLNGSTKKFENKTTGLHNLKLDSYLKSVEITERSLKEQQAIVNVLNHLNKIIQKRKKQLKKLDELVKSRFIEMFGSFPENSKNWKICTIKEIVSDVRYGTSRAAVDGGKYPYLRMNNITYDGELDLTDLKYIDIPDKELEKCTVKCGDVLFNRTNSKELVGKTCVYNRNDTMVLAGFIIRIRVNENILPVFLAMFLNMDFSKTMLKEMCKSAIGQANINATELQKIRIILPPIELQEEFVKFKNQTGKSKLEIKKSLDKLEILKKSLMQEYFS